MYFEYSRFNIFVNGVDKEAALEVHYISQTGTNIFLKGEVIWAWLRLKRLPPLVNCPFLRIFIFRLAILWHISKCWKNGRIDHRSILQNQAKCSGHVMSLPTIPAQQSILPATKCWFVQLRLILQAWTNLNTYRKAELHSSASIFYIQLLHLDNNRQHHPVRFATLTCGVGTILYLDYNRQNHRPALSFLVEELANFISDFIFVVIFINSSF